MSNGMRLIGTNEFFHSRTVASAVERFRSSCETTSKATLRRWSASRSSASPKFPSLNVQRGIRRMLQLLVESEDEL